MIDSCGRVIDYIRISITERCNLRCKYCMPTNIPITSYDDIIQYNELLRFCNIATTLGITNFKITGGEPLIRENVIKFISELKNLKNVEDVTLTTNGIYLKDNLEELSKIGIDGINISLDFLDIDNYKKFTGLNHLETVKNAINECLKSGIKTKINVVMLNENKNQLIDLALLSKDNNLDVRFIELMAIGLGKEFDGPSSSYAQNIFKEYFDNFELVDEKRGNGPSVYYKSSDLKGRIGFISANTNKFCDTCNRVRLTSAGILKPCLCYDDGTDILAPLRNNLKDEEIKNLIYKTIYNKPKEHALGTNDMTEFRLMNSIGG